MADRDLVLGSRGAFLPQDPQGLTLTLGMLPGQAAFGATVAATVRFGGAVAARVPKAAAVAATVRFGGAVAAAYDLGLPQYLGSEHSAAWQHGTRLRDDAAAQWSHAEAVRTRPRRVPWRQGGGVRTAPQRVPWRDAARVRTSPRRMPWHDGARLRTAPQRMPWRDAARLRTAPRRVPWRDAADARAALRLPWREGVRLREDRRMPWREGAAAHLPHALPWWRGAGSHRPHRLPWRDGRLIETPGGNPWPPDVLPPFVPPVDLRLCKPWFGQAAQALVLILGADPCGATIVVPVRPTYIVINDTHLIKLEGMIELPALGMQISLDADSWSWGFTATLPADQLALVAPAPDGTPVLLAAVINGASYTMLAESIQRERSFGSATIRVSGRGKNALLDAPYALTQSFSNAAGARTAVQLLDDALEVNGAPIGWSVEHDITDWLVPAGAWNVVGSHIAAAQSVAGAAGAYLQPHATADTLRVLPRYPAAPWEWGSVTPDYELPSAAVVQEGIAWVERARYNRVFVSGTGQGKLCQVTRAGTAGDVVAPMVTDALITHADAGRQRGLAVLAETGRIATVSLRLPVLEETGVIVPGKFVRYVDGAAVRLGLVRSTAVEVSYPEVWQTIGVETHE